jgi:uncharacterized protein (DUF1778 family)
MKSERIEIRLKPDEKQRVLKIADKRKTSMSKVIRKIVIENI